MNIAVCDDNELFLREIGRRLQSLPIVDSTVMFSDLDAFLLSIDSGKHYDAVLMDIEWEMNAGGMDAAAELFKLCPETKIIYVTGHVERFSQHIFLNRVSLSGFLSKPVDAELLLANLQKVADALKYQEQPSLILQQQGAPVSIPYREIYYIESRGHTVCVHTEGEVTTAYERLDSILRSLPAGFYQCHKSFIVSMGKIRRFRSGEVLLKDGSLVPVSRARYAETKEAYFSYMGSRF